MKAIETYVDKVSDPEEQAALLLERWEAVRKVIGEYRGRVVWSCQECRWVYVLFAELVYDLPIV